jgi:hypothetical protein
MRLFALNLTLLTTIFVTPTYATQDLQDQVKEGTFQFKNMFLGYKSKVKIDEKMTNKSFFHAVGATEFTIDEKEIVSLKVKYQGNFTKTLYRLFININFQSTDGKSYQPKFMEISADSIDGSPVEISPVLIFRAKKSSQESKVPA